MTAPIYYTADGTNDGLEPAGGAGGSLFTIGKVWSPSALAFVSPTVDSSGFLQVTSGYGGSAGASPENPLYNVPVDPYSYAYTWTAGKLTSIVRTKGSVSQTRTLTWDGVTGKLATISTWA